MLHEVRSIPTAPRRIRLGPLLAHRWPMFLVGCLGVALGGLWSWMLFLASQAKPSDQQRLETGPVVIAPGIVERIDPPTRNDAGELIEWDDHVQRQAVHYSFVFRDSTPDEAITLPGMSFARTGQFEVGAKVKVELLPNEPTCNRIEGTVLHLSRTWLQPSSWLVGIVAPGALLLLAWLAGVFQLRHVLIHGDVSAATVTRISPLRWVVPEMLSVRFQFRDHRAQLRSSGHWVRQRSELGGRLLHQLHTGWFEPMPVLYDRRLPQWNRLLLPHDFLPMPEVTVSGVRPS